MNVDAEQYLIGAMLRDPVKAAQIDLLPEDFTVESYGIEYKAIQGMSAMSE